MKSANLFIYLNINNKDYHIGNLVIFYSVYEKYSLFEYSDEWLNYPNSFSIDYNLPLKKGPFKSKNTKLFSIFSKTANFEGTDFVEPMFISYLIKKNLINEIHNDINIRNFYNAIKTGEKYYTNIPEFYKFQFLNDFITQGAMRFKYNIDKDFIGTNGIYPIENEDIIPKFKQIRNHIINNEEMSEELEMFRAWCFNINGRFPKLNVFDCNNDLCIAKVPDNIISNKKTFLYEVLALKIAEKYFINLQEFQLKTSSDGELYLLIKRFDRKKSKRIPTLPLTAIIDKRHCTDLNKISEVINKQCKNKLQNLQEFFKRLLIRIVLSDTKELVPNTTFLYDTEKGWNLSPEYDLTTNSNNRRKSSRVVIMQKTKKRVNFIINKRSIFRISKPKLKMIVKNLSKAIKNWEYIARDLGFSQEEISQIMIFDNVLKFI